MEQRCLIFIIITLVLFACLLIYVIRKSKKENYLADLPPDVQKYAWGDESRLNISRFENSVQTPDVCLLCPVGTNEPPNLDSLVKWCSYVSLIKDYYKVGNVGLGSKYESDVQQICAKAYDKLSTMKLPGDAAMSFDLDDTIWCTYPDTIITGFCYDQDVFDKFEKNKKFTPIHPTIKLLKEVKALGITPFFITGRQDKPDQKEWTKAELDAFNILEGRDYKQIIYHPVGDNLIASKFKTNARKQVTDLGYTIVMSIGDQWSDSGDYGGIRIKIPNPMYMLP